RNPLIIICKVKGTDRSVKGRTMETTPGPTQYPRGRGPTRGNLPYGFV
ncbi:Os07g0296900, partial [Oryza sativa Japonica Group]